MDFSNSKYKSTALTLDTYGPNTATYGLSHFQTDITDIHGQSNQLFPTQPDRQSIEDEQPNPFSCRFKPGLRQRYIYRVLGSQQNQQLPSIKHQHVFIFDWDDTLLFTTYLKGKQNTDLTLETKKQLFELDDIVCKILDFALQKGTVFIITNAFSAWVDFSSKMYLPEVHKKMESSKKIMTLSARQLFQKEFPNEMKMWKIQTFKTLKNYIPCHILTNIICVGDQQNDLEACKVLTKQFELAYIKKIKLDQRPRPSELIKQLKVLEQKLKQIFYAIASTTIKLEKRILTPQNLRKPSQDQPVIRNT